MNCSSIENEITITGLTAKLNKSNNTWYVFRNDSDIKLGIINADLDGVSICNQYTCLNASELNALVWILDRIYQRSIHFK